MIYALAKANRLPMSFVDTHFDEMIQNPEFTGFLGEGQKTLDTKMREKTLYQGMLEGFSFGFYQGEEELKNNFQLSRARVR